MDGDVAQDTVAVQSTNKRRRALRRHYKLHQHHGLSPPPSVLGHIL
jgi:hypothetical protein